MKRLAWIVPLVVLIAGVMIACEPLDQPSEVSSDLATKLETIPAEYGRLVAVTSVPEYPGWFQLWFEDTTGTIRMARIHVTQNQILRDVEVIPRSQ